MRAENPTVAALRGLSIFSADQGGAYREHYAQLAEVLGADVDTRLGDYIREWARARKAGAILLTGNAGTGKTAVAGSVLSCYRLRPASRRFTCRGGTRLRGNQGSFRSSRRARADCCP